MPEKIKRGVKIQRASSSRTARPSKRQSEGEALVQHILDGLESDAKSSQKDNDRRKNQARIAKCS